MTICNHTKITPGAHIEKQTGRGRSAKRPRSRLKFQIFPTVVELLNLDVHTRLLAAPRHTTAMFFSMNEIDGGLPAMLRREKRSKATIPMVQISSRSLIVTLAK